MNEQNNEIHFVVDSESVDNVGDADELDHELRYESVEPLDIEPSGNSSQEAFEATITAKPLMLIQRSHQHSKILPQVYNEIASKYSDYIDYGAVVPMPRMSPKQIKAYFNSIPDVSLKIADPESFARMDSFGKTLRDQRDDQPYVGPSTISNWDYLTKPLPNGPTKSWVSEVVSNQYESGATLILSPGLWLDPANSTGSLDSVREQAEWCREAVQDSDLFAVNLTLPSAWLSNPILLEKLLNVLLDLDESTFYIRVRWPLLANPYGQLLDTSILSGYIELASVLDENDKVLITANTGLTGWLLLGRGAHGLSTGLGTGERSFADTRVIKIKQKGPRPAPTPRVFESPLLHVIDKNTSDRIHALGNTGTCGCVFCTHQSSSTTAPFSKPNAGAHYLLETARLTAEVASADNRLDAVKSLVDDAVSLRLAVAKNVPLTGTNDPKHLSVWKNLLV
ncbi:hypothetical protein AB0K15_24010 [Amycolatopsis sp. NPDC049253]|uniref:hypothetical protein n=1 Tax=Amycolatopsis sp. NPDC049253 TaxID=3155274 RepID=UPI003432EBB5